MNNRNSDPKTHHTADDVTPPLTTGQPVEIHPAIVTWALVIGLVVAFVVTASSFKLSFATLYDLAAMAGMRDSAWVIPVVLDGPILAAGIFRVALSQHTDHRTVLGRRFIIAVFALAGLASMAGNAYHAVLTVTDLNAGVAAALGALAPLMVMTMSEMMSIAISAPRHRRPSAVLEATEAEQSTTGPQNTTEQSHEPLADEHGTLDQVVWETVDVYLNHPTAMGKFNKAAEVLGVSPTTVRSRYDKWVNLQQKIAATKAAPQLSTQPAPAESAVDTGDALENLHPADIDTYMTAEHDYAVANH
ncbi:DUF2637 domain-containing protein [Rhodococcoides fascians]|uniref:DUF2637 domain-containing protein n=1 Tax=Rhodococcoides fascians TaxID=1828 RepID=UPI0009E95667|nr:DUF2637 domain-containing protein [Rhodococcus fascians]